MSESLQNTTAKTETSPVVQLAQNTTTTTTTETSSMGEQLQNSTTTAETISISGTSLHQQTVRQPFKRKKILAWLLNCKVIRVGDLVRYKTNLNGTKTYELVIGLVCNGAIT